MTLCETNVDDFVLLLRAFLLKWVAFGVSRTFSSAVALFPHNIHTPALISDPTAKSDGAEHHTHDM